MFCRVTQCLIPGSSGSATRGLLGLHSIKAEIGKRKLYLLGRIINSSSSLAHRKLFTENLLNGNGGRAIQQCQGLSLIL